MDRYQALANLLIVSCTVAQLPAQVNPAGQVVTSSPSAYFDARNGTSVEQLVSAALARNAELLAARQRITEAQGLLRQSGFRPNPGVEVTFGTGSFLGSSGERELSVGYSHIFELGGKRQRRIEVSELGIKLAQFEVADRERQLRADVGTRYGEALAAIRNLEIAQRQLQLNQETFQITTARVREGEAPAIDQGLLQVEVGRLESDRTLFENQVVRALFAVKPLVGMSADDALRLNGNLRAMPVNLSLEQALEKALASRPDLEAVRLEEKLREAETRAAKAEAVPNVIATGRYSRTNSEFPQLGLNSAGASVPLRDLDNVVTAGLSITLPVRNRNQGNIAAAEARTESARLRSRFLEQVVAQEVRSAYSRYQAASQALRIFDQRVLDRSQDNLRIIRAAYTSGELRLFDVLNEQRRLTDTQRAYTDVLKEYFVAVVELERAVGSPLP
ncbi:MAG TPA: TolC family protein [Terriglobales bacterium]|nr:TolC family protein [Terriglobales bacterium]